jgi:hypothetical protein
LIWLDDTAVAVRFDGTDGGVVSVADRVVTLKVSLTTTPMVSVAFTVVE